MLRESSVAVRGLAGHQWKHCAHPQGAQCSPSGSQRRLTRLPTVADDKGKSSPGVLANGDPRIHRPVVAHMLSTFPIGSRTGVRCPGFFAPARVILAVGESVFEDFREDRPLVGNPTFPLATAFA